MPRYPRTKTNGPMTRRKAMAGDDELRSMLMSFRVSELQMLLGYAGGNKTGRKTELQARAIELLKTRSTPVLLKIRELYKSIQQGIANGTVIPDPPSSGSGPYSNNMPLRQPQQSMGSGMLNNPPPTYPDYQQQQMGRSSGYTQMQKQYPMYGYQQANAQHMSQKQAPNPNQYPVHPDVKFKRLPFYDILGELIKPSSLTAHGNQRSQEQSFQFYLTPYQANEIAYNREIIQGQKAEYTVQVQVRFCLLETSCEQMDCFPSNIFVKVNNKTAQLPNFIVPSKQGQEQKRLPKPVNVTPLIKISPVTPNIINVAWTSEYGRGFVIGVYLVRKLNSNQLLQRLKQKGIRHQDYTMGLIKEKFNENSDCEIATTSLRASLMCPLGKLRMTHPCRASTCTHLQCFDALLFLQMNERKPTWICPVCDKPCLYDNLVIDGYFQEVLNSPRMPGSSNDIQLLPDGSWSVPTAKKEPTHKATTQARVEPIVETLIDDIEIVPIPKEEVTMVEEKKEKDAASSASASGTAGASAAADAAAAEKKKAEVIDLTFSDSEDEDASKKSTWPAANSTARIGSDSGSCVSTPGPSSVTSSGYQSPNVIPTIDIIDDSPSPSPTPASPAASMPPPEPSSCLFK
ncbi:E3 SUMO-protein ligase PIAS2 isoform X2 [Bemisia tabaci]|uniref:E3 SUMO-protein ligase PIAS2 isoform X2 n=1 Tax=Bemisia tabaci TaxID=7038 RepID=UPI0008F99D53|nr:PREDICTED: E3 SUMO-protein ligase PIAS2 isoform X2 [Bemisia tabaci]